MQSAESVKNMFDRGFVRVADNLQCHHASRAVQSRDQPITVTSLCREAKEKINVAVKNIRPTFRDVNLKCAIVVTANQGLTVKVVGIVDGSEGCFQLGKRDVCRIIQYVAVVSCHSTTWGNDSVDRAAANQH